ncbi:MAG: M55 family metallopeptidase [Eubacteriales bacterium]
MKLFISSDIEGTTGITAWDETEWSDPRSLYFREQMTRETAAACEGAADAGFGEIWVKDAHDSARNIIPDRLPENVKLLRGWIGDMHGMMGGISRSSFDAAAMTGYHSWAAGEGNPLSHTMNSKNQTVKINGTMAPEFMINAYIAGYYNIPVCFVSGDLALCDFAKTLIPNITAVAVNEGMGGAVLSISPILAVKRIKEGMYHALTRDFTDCAVNMPDRFEIEINFKKHTDAYARSYYPGAQKVSSTSVLFKTSDWLEAMRFMNFVL